MTDDLVSWLRTQLDEDERIAIVGKVAGIDWRVGEKAQRVDLTSDDTDDASDKMLHRFGPARVLVEVDAKRRILDEHGHDGGGWDGEGKRCNECGGYDVVPGYGWKGYRRSWPCQTLRLLALPYADREGYRQEWRPA